MKFSTQNKLSMLTMNKFIGIYDLDPKLQIQANVVPKLKFATIFMKFGMQSKSTILIMKKLLGSEKWKIDCSRATKKNQNIFYSKKKSLSS